MYLEPVATVEKVKLNSIILNSLIVIMILGCFHTKFSSIDIIAIPIASSITSVVLFLNGFLQSNSFSNYTLTYKVFFFLAILGLERPSRVQWRDNSYPYLQRKALPLELYSPNNSRPYHITLEECQRNLE